MRGMHGPMASVAITTLLLLTIFSHTISSAGVYPSNVIDVLEPVSMENASKHTAPRNRTGANGTAQHRELHMDINNNMIHMHSVADIAYSQLNY